MATTSTYTLLQRISVTSAVSSVTFSNIPQTGYTDLKIVFSARGTQAAGSNALTLRFNSVTTNYSSRELVGDGGSGGSSTRSNLGSAMYVGNIDGNTATSNTFGNGEIVIPNYSNSGTYKSINVNSVVENNASEGYLTVLAGLSSTTAAVASIDLISLAAHGNLMPGSTFSLYATSAVGTTPGTPKALGGDIVVNDGTYWYHAFLNSGTFVPQSALTCDALVVAGGGSGGSRNGVGGAGGGGGGAGGLRLISSQTLSSSASYVATIGAGGVTPIAANTYTRGTSGTNSSFAGSGITTISTTGGGAGGIVNAAPLTGGSGGGGGGGSGSNNVGATGNAGSYSPIEGYAGGNGNTDNSGGGVPYPAGGGGGAGSAGTNYSGSTPGTGGSGASSYNSISFSSWLTATKTGDSGVMSKGGNGGTWTSPSGDATSGIMNTGSGGSGGGTGTGGSGGSGIIIIRYAV